jgi:dTDP-4-amino-4,6-dideoxygalactose transaminase
MRVPFLDLKTQYQSIREEISVAVHRVLESSQYILGPEIAAFEKAFALAHNSSECIATNNGTSALHLALWALGIKAGDEVILPANTFIATAEAVLLCGAKPIFADHDEYYTLDPEDVDRKITRRTRGIMPVHLYGQIAEMEELTSIARRHGLIIVEDAAQAHLASWDGKKAGAWGAATGFSFYPGKNLGAYGEAGAVLTNDPALAEKMRRIRDHGSENKYWHTIAGHNYRLEALQGAILGVKLSHLGDWTDARRQHAEQYCKLLADIPEIQLPKIRNGAEHVYHLFVIQAAERDALRVFLEQREIATGLHYPIPLHLQPCFQNLGYKEGAFPRAERGAKRILSLPMYPELMPEQIAFVAENIREFYMAKGARS